MNNRVGSERIVQPGALLRATQILSLRTGKTITEYLADRGMSRGIDLADGGGVVRSGAGRRYEIVRVISQGDVGVLYEAKDLNCRRTVALRVINRDTPCSDAELLKFVEEAQITAQLEHPNIVPIHEVGVDADGNVFYTMKHVTGMTLDQVLLEIRRGNIDIILQYPLARLLTIFQNVCDALAFAHSRNVIHRNLKPENILLGNYGEVLVMGWGGAVVFPLDPSVLEPPLRVPENKRGSVGYKAPEQLLNLMSDVRSDIYSLGATLYSMLTLRLPFSGRDPERLMTRILAGVVIPPESYNRRRKRRGSFWHCPESRIPRALSEVAVKAMAIAPDQRFQSVQDLQREIEAYQQGRIWHMVTDDVFSDPEALAHWEIIGGRHEVVDGELKLCHGQPQILLFKQEIAGDVRIEFECRQTEVYLNCVGCFLGSIVSENRKEISSSGYRFEYGGNDNSLTALTRSDRRLAGIPHSPLRKDQRCHIMAERCGNRLRLVVDGIEMINHVDDDPLTGAERTAIGLVGWLAETRYSRIRIFTLGSPWKSDILDVAERQAQKGNYRVAEALIRDAMESFPEPTRLERAKAALEKVRHHEEHARQLNEWREKLAAAWPNAEFHLRADSEGLSLELDGSGITDLEPLRGMPLTALYCACNRIESLEPLRGMPLMTLNCNGNPIASLEPLRGMPLVTLVAEACNIESLEPLRGMPLTFLSFGGGQVESLEPLRGMSLLFLCCWRNRITDLDPLRGMPLSVLYFGSNRVRSLEPLRGIPLVTVNCSGNLIESLEPLRDAPLNVLHCGNNSISDLSPLSGTSLKILSAHGNRIDSLAPIEDLGVGSLTCGNNPIVSLGKLVDNPPNDFRFAAETLPDEELRRVIAAWRHDPIKRRQVEVLLALRHDDKDSLLALADEFDGRRYLFVPRFMRWNDAKVESERLGGSLLTIHSQEENDFVASLFPMGCWLWLGLETDADGHRWVTGESVRYTNFVDRLQETKLGPKVFSGKWFRDDELEATNSFIVKW